MKPAIEIYRERCDSPHLFTPYIFKPESTVVKPDPVPKSLSASEKKIVIHYEQRLRYQAKMLSRGESLKAEQEQAAWNYLRYHGVLENKLQPIHEIRFPVGYEIKPPKRSILKSLWMAISLPRIPLIQE